MPDYSYEALTADGVVSRGRMTASSELELENHLRRDGSFLIRAEVLLPSAAQGGGTATLPPERKRSDGTIPRRDLLAFTEYLWGSAQAGIPILTTLADVEVQVESRLLRRITAELREAMTEEGKTLSEALAEHPRAFPTLYVGTVEAGETTGQLDYALQQLVEYLEWQQEIGIQIRQATLYPTIVLSVMFALVALLVGFVYPRLMPIFEGFDIALPWPTRVVLSTGDFVRNQWRVMIAAIVSAVVAWHLVGRTSRGRMTLDTVKLRMPVFGPLIHQLEMARVVTYMALFYRTGVDLLRGFLLLERIVKNRRVARALGEARLAISGGDSIAHSLGATGMFPPVVIRSFALGEATGKLDESLDRARAYYAREVPAAVRRMLSSLQPLLILVLGGVLAMVAMSIFLPMMSIYQAVGR